MVNLIQNSVENVVRTGILKHFSNIVFSFFGILSSAVFAQQSVDDFVPLESFGANPGELSASYISVTENNSALVVLLHGCVQNGEKLANQSGFTALAKNYGFSLLVPQQHTTNNIKDCFNWFSAQDIEKDSGELLSLKNMISSFKEQTKSSDVFIVGLSAGGAMASTLLSTYPELFNAGAIIAGIPYPCADNLTKAISCMRFGPSQSPKELAKIVKGDQSHNSATQWPRLSIWTGNDDKVVNPKNAQFLARQWAALSLNTSNSQSSINRNKANQSNVRQPSIIKHKTTKHQGYQKTVWKNVKQQVAVELIEVDGLGHGLMVKPNEKYGGSEGDFLLSSVLASAEEIVKFWQLKERKIDEIHK